MVNVAARWRRLRRSTTAAAAAPPAETPGGCHERKPPNYERRCPVVEEPPAECSGGSGCSKGSSQMKSTSRYVTLSCTFARRFCWATASLGPNRTVRVRPGFSKPVHPNGHSLGPAHQADSAPYRCTRCPYPIRRKRNWEALGLCHWPVWWRRRRRRHRPRRRRCSKRQRQ
jgi:hypothetical protein